MLKPPTTGSNIFWTRLGSTPCKINMEPKNGGLEDDFAFQLGDF